MSERESQTVSSPLKDACLAGEAQELLGTSNKGLYKATIRGYVLAHTVGPTTPEQLPKFRYSRAYLDHIGEATATQGLSEVRQMEEIAYDLGSIVLCREIVRDAEDRLAAMLPDEECGIVEAAKALNINHTTLRQYKVHRLEKDETGILVARISKKQVFGLLTWYHIGLRGAEENYASKTVSLPSILDSRYYPLN